MGCEQAQPQDSFVGAWRLVSWEQRTASGDVSYPYGMTAQGQIVYTANGQMSAQLMNPGADLAGVTASGTEEIIGRAADTYFAYYGTYELDESAQTVTHRVQGSLAPNWVGSDQVRQFEFLSNGRLQLTAIITEEERVSDSAIGPQVLVWERIE
jgi:hypothetical protein